VPELLRGVADAYLGGRLAPRIGVARAKYLLFTAQYFSARDAYDMGWYRASSRTMRSTPRWTRPSRSCA
jgi:enoyl-CoA hydratase/carnithine racemase